MSAAITDQVSARSLMEYTKSIGQWVRLSGTPEELRAAQYVQGVLEGLGYESRLILHDAYISLPGKASLAVVSAGGGGAGTTGATAATGGAGAVGATWDFACITHSMGLATPPGGVEGELVYGGRGSVKDLKTAGAAGKTALIEGRATPQLAADATAAGAKGIVCISGKYPHEMCCSPVWGSPGASTVAQLPKVHILSVGRDDGTRLREMCHQGKVVIRYTAAIDVGWRKTPIVTGDLRPVRAAAGTAAAAGDCGEEAATDAFVLLSGHLDSWYLGVMDNGTANATQLEMARLFAMPENRARMRRGLRVAFWSGHSHGRYSGSAWYADNHWRDLHDNCVCHVNVDSLGAVGADRFVSLSMPETAGLGRWAVETATGGQYHLEATRANRSSDQSFWGPGVPSLFGCLTVQNDGSGLGWFWHTPHDTLDKIDPERLVRDARVFSVALERLLCDEVLPLDYAATAADIRANLERLQASAAGRFDLSGEIAEAARLEDLCRKVAERGGKVEVEVESGAEVAADLEAEAKVAEVNACLHDLGRILIPMTYQAAGAFAHDPALDLGFLPTLAGVRELAALGADTDEARLLLVDLVRARNQLGCVLRKASARAAKAA